MPRYSMQHTRCPCATLLSLLISEYSRKRIEAYYFLFVCFCFGQLLVRVSWVRIDGIPFSIFDNLFVYLVWYTRTQRYPIKMSRWLDTLSPGTTASLAAFSLTEFIFQYHGYIFGRPLVMQSARLCASPLCIQYLLVVAGNEWNERYLN